jgi:CRP-like cAMP-binding protein
MKSAFELSVFPKTQVVCITKSLLFPSVYGTVYSSLAEISGANDRETDCAPALRQESAMSSDPRCNLLLKSLSLADFESIRSNLRLFDLKYEAVLVEAGGPVIRVYFPHSGIISLVVRLADGQVVEAAMVGRDGVFGAVAALDGQISSNTAVVQMAGKASTLDVALLRTATERSASLRAALVRYEQVVYAQALQSAACNASHTVECRLSRWLLRARSVWQGQVNFLPGILGSDAGCASQQRVSRRQFAPTVRPYPL